MELHNDEWLMHRISEAISSVLYAKVMGLEAELDMIQFAEDVLEHYAER